MSHEIDSREVRSEPSDLSSSPRRDSIDERVGQHTVSAGFSPSSHNESVTHSGHDHESIWQQDREQSAHESFGLKEKEPSEELQPTTLQKVLDEIELLLLLNFFGICGSMGRNGLVELLAFENLGSVWPNFTGCFLISFIPAVVGPLLTVTVTTGFCGAMSSFSELITDIFTEATTPTPSWPNHGYGVPLFMARFLVEISCCFAAYTAGSHFGIHWSALGIRKLTPHQEVAIARVMEALGAAAWIVCLVTSITSPNRSRWWPMSGIFAPFGVWLRYYLSKLNRPNKWFKTGTFAANIFSTLVACVLQTCVLLPQTNPVQKQVMLALQRGFCGCLSTISTFVKEMNTMSVKHAYAYGFISLFIGYSLAFIITGSYKWT